MNKSFTLGVALLSAMQAFASEPIDTTKIVELQDVQVVSTRATKKTPMAFTNMSKDQIKSLNHGKDIPDILSMTPSVTMTSDAGNGIGYTSMMVRGSDNTRVNITANGIPLNDSESSGLYWVNFGDLVSSAEDIQIQRGVGTSTNGAGAFGATVNIQTEKIGVNPFVGIDLSAGSYYSHKETVRFGTGLLGGHWGVQGRLSNIGSKGYLDRAWTKLNSYFLQAGYFGDNTVVKFVTFNGQEQTYHAWNYTSKYEQETYGRTYNSCGQYTAADGSTAYYPNQTDNYHSQNYQLIWNQNLGNYFKLNAALHYTRGDGYYEEYKTNKSLADYGVSIYRPITSVAAKGNVTYGDAQLDEGIYSDLIRRKQMGNDFYGAVASLTYDNKNGINAIFGGGWNLYDGDHFGNVIWVRDYNSKSLSTSGVGGKRYNELTPDFEYYRNNARKTDFNVYGKLTYELMLGLNAFVDLQYRRVNLKMQNPEDDYWGTKYTGDYSWKVNKTYNFFNPKFGLNYQFADNHRVYASVGIGHKEPTRNDFEDNIGKDLKAETLVDWEAGYQYTSPTFSAGVNFYYMNYTDQFVLTGQLNSIGEPLKANSGKSYRVGVELEAAWQPVDWFTWSANASFSRNRNKQWKEKLADMESGADYVKDDDGNVVSVDLGETPISFSPSVLFNNIFTFKYEGFKAAIQSRYVGEQYLSNTGFKEYYWYDSNMSEENTVGMTLKSHFTTNLDLSYTTKALKKYGLKDATIGVTLYNIFSTKYDNNGWASAAVAKNSDGKLIAVATYDGWHYYDDPYEAGFAPSAPFNFMVNLSLNF